MDEPEHLRRQLRRGPHGKLRGARILREARTASRPQLRTSQPWRWINVAAAVVVMAGGVWVLALSPRGADRDAILHEAVASHVRSLMANHLTDVASTDQHTVKPWFSDKVDFSPPVTDFAAEGFLLIGGRLDYLDHRPVAALVYQHRKHMINVFVWRSPRIGMPPRLPCRIRGTRRSTVRTNTWPT